MADHKKVQFPTRVQEVVKLVAKGLTNRQIAAQLCVAEKTVEGYVTRALKMTGTTNRTQLAAWVMAQGKG